MIFSIITICKNDRNRIVKTLNSVCEQDFNGYEHIIEDGSSDHDTKELVETCYSDKKEIVYFSEKDNGIYDAMNRAILKAQGDFVCFLNAGDCFLNSTILSDVYRIIEGNPSGDFFYGGAVVVFPDGTENSQIIPLDEDVLCSRETLESVNLHLIHQAIFVRRSVFDSCKFDCTYSLRAELDWYYQCFNAGIRFIRINFPICTYELGGVSERSSAAQKSINETADILVRYGYSPSAFLEELRQTHLTKGVYKYIYNEWLSLKLSGYSMKEYLLQHGYKKIALYGYGELGCHVIRELKDSPVEIYLIIEKGKRYPYSNIKIIKPEELTGRESVDVMIVTAIMHFEEIHGKYSSIAQYPIISLERILENMWNRV